MISWSRSSKSKSAQPQKRRPARGGEVCRGYWLLQDTKARFSELVRRVRSEGPQHVIVYGRDEVIAVEDFRRLRANATGKALIKAMQASPCRDTDIGPKRKPMPVRDP